MAFLKNFFNLIIFAPGTSCSFRNGGCSHHCNDTGASRVCSCYDGYSLQSDQRTCRGEFNHTHRCTIQANSYSKDVGSACKHFFFFQTLMNVLQAQVANVVNIPASTHLALIDVNAMMDFY